MIRSLHTHLILDAKLRLNETSMVLQAVVNFK